MKALTLTSTLILALSLSSFGESISSLTSKISVKEKELAALEKEIASLKSQLKETSSSSQSYSVKSGDTLSSIARRYKVKTADLISWNKITDPTKLSVGQSLSIQGGTPVRSSSTSSNSGPTSSYTIVKGDTFYSIARTHKMTVSQLRDLNPDVSTHLIAAGQTLTISGTPVVRTAKATPKPAPDKKTSVAKVTPPPAKKSSTPAPVAKKTEAPAPAPKKEAVADAKPATPPAKEEKVAAKSSIASIILTNETTFDAFASKYGTSTDQLNALNGWNLPKATVLARGSEIYVPQ